MDGRATGDAFGLQAWIGEIVGAFKAVVREEIVSAGSRSLSTSATSGAIGGPAGGGVFGEVPDPYYFIP